MSALAVRTGLAAEQLPRLFAGALAERPLTLAEHTSSFGELPAASGRSRREALLEVVAGSGLSGRGGAGFPTARKLRAVASARARPVVVANGVEGEPVSDKDKALMRHAPHLVLDGAALAASMLDAREAIVAVAESARHERAVLVAALAERDRARLDSVRLRIASVRDGFVSGEETALLHALGGGPAIPTRTPPRPFEKGLGGAPTLVQNVETLAHLALLARYGASWFRGVGTPEEPGSALVTLSGAIARPGVYEAPLGLPLAELLHWANGPTEPVGALLVGGYFGSWIPIEDALRLRLLARDIPGGLGARAIVALPRTACGLVETARIVRYLAGESAGQCGPCVHGLDAIAGAFECLAAREDVERAHAHLERWTRQVAGRGACRHPDGAIRLVESALRCFAGEVDLHAQGHCGGRRRAPLPTGTAQ